MLQIVKRTTAVVKYYGFERRTLFSMEGSIVNACMNEAARLGLLLHLSSFRVHHR